jgi:SAM-dependent methyltransferase
VNFAVPADAYDRFMGRYSSQLSSQVADLARVGAGQRVLDVGCGSGMLTGELVLRVGAGAVAAIDPSEQFVAAVRERRPGVDVRYGVAEQLPFGDGEFDAALAQLVVHFLSDAPTGLREMARVTRPGGVVVACVWDFAGGRAPISPFWEAVREIDPRAEDESRLPGVREDDLVSLLRSAGLRDVVGSVLEAVVTHPTFQDWWQPYELGVGPAGVYVAGLDRAGREAVREACRRQLGDEPFTLHAYAWAARGVVPFA